MRNAIGFILCLCILLGVVELFCRTHVPTNTYLGNYNISYFSRPAILRLLAQEADGQFQLSVHGRIYNYQYKKAGVYIDVNKTLSAIFAHTKHGPLYTIQSFSRSFFSQRMIIPTVSFSDLFYAKYSQAVYDVSTNENDVQVNAATKKLLFTDNTQKYRVDPKLLKQQIASSIGMHVVLEPVTTRISDTTEEAKVLSYNQRIATITAKPVGIVLEGEKHASFELTETELLSVLTISYDRKTDNLDIGVAQDTLSNILHSKVANVGKNDDFIFNNDNMRAQLISMVAARFNGYTQNFVTGRLQKKPNTDGTFVSKYIEIDISQQQMYVWDNGRIIATHGVSTGLYYPTPPGKYKILNKAPNAYSDIYHVWMPYWMAFYLDPKVNAYLGIHELPYWVDGTGTQIRRPSNFIGSPHTGGCVSLDVGEAQEVYNWAQVGTAVLIYE